MKRFGQIGAGVAAALLCLSCGEKPYTGGGTSGSAAAEQHFIVAVESMGELFTGGEGVDVPVATRRPISSVAPTQTFDLLSIIIVEYASPARVVFKRTIGSWSSPDNMASIPWSLESGQGRYATVTLSGDECLEEGHTYMAYVIGYQSGTFGGYEPFRDFEVGDVYNRTEVASVPAGGSAEEIFAGAELFEVRDGAILSGRGNGTTIGQGVLVARRQVAGTFGYFTRIPVRVSGRDVAALRLVATRRNRSLIFGGFRGLDDLFDFSKDNVINGMNPRTDYDARLAGSRATTPSWSTGSTFASGFPGMRSSRCCRSMRTATAIWTMVTTTGRWTRRPTRRGRSRCRRVRSSARSSGSRWP